MQAIKLTEPSIKQLAEVITGDGEKSPYRSGRDLVVFFNEHGAKDSYGQGFPARWAFAEEKLREFNCTPTMAGILTSAVDPRHFVEDEEHSVEEAVAHLNTFLKYDRLQPGSWSTRPRPWRTSCSKPTSTKRQGAPSLFPIRRKRARSDPCLVAFS